MELLKKKPTNRQKGIACLVLLILCLCSLGYSMYSYSSWQNWKSCTEQTLAYAAYVTPQNYREEVLQKWNKKDQDRMIVLTDCAREEGMQILSFHALFQDAEGYEAEVCGSYYGAVSFLNRLEYALLFSQVQLVKMEKKEETLILHIRI